MIKTKEEINLRYLADPGELRSCIRNGDVEKNDETRQAVVDLGDAEAAFWYAFEVHNGTGGGLAQVINKDGFWALYARLHIGDPPLIDSYSLEIEPDWDDFKIIVRK